MQFPFMYVTSKRYDPLVCLPICILVTSKRYDPLVCLPICILGIPMHYRASQSK